MKVVIEGTKTNEVFEVKAEQQTGFVRIYVNGIGVVEIIEEARGNGKDKPLLAICNSAVKVINRVSNYSPLPVEDRAY